MNKVIYLAVFILLAISSFFLLSKQQKTMILINNNIAVNIEVASTKTAQTKGLSNRQELAEGTGMLFVYSDYAIRSFWMKNMNFPIDIIWIIDEDIVGFDENLAPEGDNPIKRYHSPVPVNYVLEVPAGFVQKYGIRVGDVVQLKN